MDELAILERLVRRYSPSGQEAAAVREFARIARELGYAVRIDAVGNGIAHRGNGRPRIDFLGHIDTVDGELPVRRRGDRLQGRGVVDAKGPLVAGLLAGREWKGPGEYRVLAAVGEETDSRGARHLVRGRPPEVLLVGEPSNWDGVTIGYKGLVRAEARFRGARTHHSSPIPTAMDRAADWIGAVRSYAAAQAGTSPFRSLTVKVIGLSGDAVNGEENARVALDVRVPPGTTTAGVIGALPPLTRGALATPVRIEPVEIDRTSPPVAALLSGIRSVGGRPTLWQKGGTSDLNLAVAAWDLPAAAYGPGDPRLDHTDRESLAGSELRRSVEVLRVALERLRRSVYSSTIGRRSLMNSP